MSSANMADLISSEPTWIPVRLDILIIYSDIGFCTKLNKRRQWASLSGSILKNEGAYRAPVESILTVGDWYIFWRNKVIWPCNPSSSNTINNYGSCTLSNVFSASSVIIAKSSDGLSLAWSNAIIIINHVGNRRYTPHKSLLSRVKYMWEYIGQSVSNYQR